MQRRHNHVGAVKVRAWPGKELTRTLVPGCGFELLEITLEEVQRFRLKPGAGLGRRLAVAQAGGKNQTGGLPTGPAVGPGQKL